MFEKIKEMIGIKKQVATKINGPVVMEDGAVVVCQDVGTDSTITTKIIPQHVSDNVNFPRFIVTKTAARHDSYGMWNKVVLALDTDNAPSEGSINLLTSGAIYEVINDLQNQIDELKARLNNENDV